MKKDFSILIGGAAGEGSKKAGLIIAKFLSSYGYNIYVYEDYQSIIKGGHNFSLIRASENKVAGSKDKIDFLLALNNDTIQLHKDKLNDKKNLIYNSKIPLNKGIAIPIEEITEEFSGVPIMKNTALVAAFAKVIGINWSTTKKVLERELPISTELNLKIAKATYDRTENLISIEKLSSKNLPLLSGNEAIALGALSAGLESYVGYPMTPATGILNYMSSVAVDYNLNVFQPENEISVINTAIGLAFSGKKTMIASSGGGFALMNEGLSLAAQSETPLVIVEAQRMGPSTGAPTYNGQSDLLYVLSAGHGDFKRFVVAPGDAEEAFYLTGLALKISWKYQLPSIVLSDKEVSESTFSFDDKEIPNVLLKPSIWSGKGEYLRYKDTKDGISPMAFPGTKNIIVKGTSYEHNEMGIAIDSEEGIEKMQNKRLKKYKSLEKEVSKINGVKIYGNKKSKKSLVVWGLTKGPAIEAALNLGIKVVQPIIFQPFPEKQIKKALEGSTEIICAETNSTGQLASLLEGCGFKLLAKILKYNGRPFTAVELEKKLKSKFSK